MGVWTNQVALQRHNYTCVEAWYEWKIWNHVETDPKLLTFGQHRPKISPLQLQFHTLSWPFPSPFSYSDKPVTLFQLSLLHQVQIFGFCFKWQEPNLDYLSKNIPFGKDTGGSENWRTGRENPTANIWKPEIQTKAPHPRFKIPGRSNWPSLGPKLMAMWWAEGVGEEQDGMEGMGRNSPQKEQQISYLNKEQGVLLRQK